MAKINFNTYPFYANSLHMLIHYDFFIHYVFKKASSAKSIYFSEHVFTNPVVDREIFFCLVNSAILVTFNQFPNHVLKVSSAYYS